MDQPKNKHTVHWFRKGLRLHDNPSLREGLVEATTFRCIFILDPWFASASNVGINKWRSIYSIVLFFIFTHRTGVRVLGAPESNPVDNIRIIHFLIFFPEEISA